MQDQDPTEAFRRQRQAELNGNNTREQLEAAYGAVYDTAQLQETFSVQGFMAPYCVVNRKSDGVKGSIEFQHSPRFYFNFQPS